MRFLHIVTMIFTITFIGCAKSNIIYNSEEDQTKKMQFYENKQCSFFIGPFNTEKDFNIDQLINATIKKANKDGLYGNKLINIKIQKDGYTAILFTKYCLYIQGNLIYTKEI
ncbi:MAG: hypothetical protein U9N59_00465 [Campylobacterota bacterium]|nr:hypothetical protein [Campylobacterota bacterium]